MSRQELRSGNIVPAHVSFLAIYNPEFGSGKEDGLSEQIVYWYAKTTESQKNAQAGDQEKKQELQNEKLRQVGLAQGIVKFARTFGNGKPVNSIETDKHRIVLTELEKDWWIVASITLTSITAARSPHGSVRDKPAASSVEYTSRELGTPELLLQHLRQANEIFLLHHAPSLAQFWKRSSKEKFVDILDIFWTQFVQNWDVLLHGNPAVDIFNGIKLAAGGELGVGVGEEEWGSGDREVLEGMITGTEGLIDMVVVRYGEDAGSTKTQNSPDPPTSWLSVGNVPDPADGVIFSGAGRLSSQSLRAISHWINSIFAHGENAYAVKENPKHGRAGDQRRARNRRRQTDEEAQRMKSKVDENDSGEQQEAEDVGDSTTTNASITETEPATSSTGAQHGNDAKGAERRSSTYHITDSLPRSDQMMKYLTLGYGSVWTGFGKRLPRENEPQAQVQRNEDGRDEPPDASSSHGERSRSRQREAQQATKVPAAHFVIGVRGNLDSIFEEIEDGEQGDTDVIDNSEIIPDTRTIYAQLNEGTETSKPMAAGFQRLKVVVYAHQPFLFVFVFEPNTFSLTMPTFYRNLHLHLLPLHKSLVKSTDPSSVAHRLQVAFNSGSNGRRMHATPSGSSSIYDLIFDRSSLMIHSSIPNLPAPGGLVADRLDSSTWSRIEGLGVHLQVLNTYAETRENRGDLEQTGKTRHDWWIIWMRIPPSMKNGLQVDAGRDAFLFRRSSESNFKPGGTIGRLTGRDAVTSSTASVGGSWRPTRLAEGIGVDARKYVESLLSLAR